MHLHLMGVAFVCKSLYLTFPAHASRATALRQVMATTDHHDDDDDDTVQSDDHDDNDPTQNAADDAFHAIHRDT